MKTYFNWMLSIVILLSLSLITIGGLSSCDDGLCSNTCSFADDGTCDDGGTNSVYDLCDIGTDCEDCGRR